MVRLFVAVVASSNTGERFYECPAERCEDGSLHYPVLHVAVDQGQHGMAAWVWMLLGKGLRLTLCWDVFHRVHNDVLAATAAAGLASVRLDAMHLLKFREGAFCLGKQCCAAKGECQGSPHFQSCL